MAKTITIKGAYKPEKLVLKKNTEKKRGSTKKKMTK